jgi:hypothetical protein
LLSLSTTAASSRSFSSVTARDHFDVSPFLQTSLADGYTEYGFETEGEIPGYQTGDSPEELLVFPNAWDKARADVDRRFPKYQNSLAQAGYDHPSIVFEWSSQDNPALWKVTVEKGRLAGKKLGQFLKEYRARNPETTIRMIGFSLGATVALSAIESLYDRGWRGTIDSLALLGASTEDGTIALEGKYGPACETILGEVDNFYKTDDELLSGAFTVAELDDAFGTVGIEGTPPANYEEHQVDWVDGHDYYWSYEKGCIRSVVAEWADDDRTESGTDPAASGSADTPVTEPTVDSFEASMETPNYLEAHRHQFALEEHDRIVVELTEPPAAEYTLSIREGTEPLSAVDPRITVESTSEGSVATVPAGTFDPSERFWIMVESDEHTGRYSLQVREYPPGAN